MAGAAHNRGNSKQNYATPPEFIVAVESRFGEIAIDLAADEHNTKAAHWFSERIDSFKQDWAHWYQQHCPVDSLLWLNPPFNHIAPWAAKCAAESARGARIAFLVPASVGSNWYRDHVHERAAVYFLNGRICFDGKNGFPKDCMLCVFGDYPTIEVWNWREQFAETIRETGT